MATGIALPEKEAPISRTAQRRIVPVKWFAAIGALWLLIAGQAIVRWLAAGPHQITTGRNLVPEFMKIACVAFEIGGCVATIAMIYFMLWRPWHRERRVAFDGLLCLAMLTCEFQDNFANFAQYNVTFNTYLLNLGSWYNFLPGWTPPGASHLAEAAVFGAPFYVCGAIPPIILVNWLMRKAKLRWPQIGNFGLVMICYGSFVVVDVVLETLWLYLGIYSYTGVSGPTLFKGTYHQYPLYELVGYTVTWTLTACLRYFKNDRGESFAERGISKLRMKTGRKTLLRFLALAAAVNLLYLGCNILFGVLSLHQDSWPKDVLSRPYFTNGLCGPGTSYACPGPGTPLIRLKSSHVTPSGTLHPAGPLSGTGPGF